MENDLKLVANVYSPNGDIKLSDIITSIQAGRKGSYINVRITTVDKYVGWLDTSEGVTVVADKLVKSDNITLTNLDEGEQTPWEWTISLDVFSGDGIGRVGVITPLKHEYFVSFVPLDDLVNYGCLEDVAVEVSEKSS